MNWLISHEATVIVDMIDGRPDEWKLGYIGDLSGPHDLKVDSFLITTVKRGGSPIGLGLFGGLSVMCAMGRWKARHRQLTARKLLSDMDTEQQRRMFQNRQTELQRELEYIQKRLREPT